MSIPCKINCINAYEDDNISSGFQYCKLLNNNVEGYAVKCPFQQYAGCIKLAEKLCKEYKRNND